MSLSSFLLACVSLLIPLSSYLFSFLPRFPFTPTFSLNLSPSLSFILPRLSLSLCGSPCRVPNLFIISALCQNAGRMLKYKMLWSGYKWAGVFSPLSLSLSVSVHIFVLLKTLHPLAVRRRSGTHSNNKSKDLLKYILIIINTTVCSLQWKCANLVIFFCAVRINGGWICKASKKIITVVHALYSKSLDVIQ